jgi:hypothetical protein
MFDTLQENTPTLNPECLAIKEVRYVTPSFPNTINAR